MDKMDGNKLVKDETAPPKASCGESSASPQEEEDQPFQFTRYSQNLTTKFTDFLLEEMLGRFRKLNVKQNNCNEMPAQEDDKERLALKKLVTEIRNGQIKNIITVVGAGISTSAGIPDFRSPGSGLYNNLSKYNLPYAQAIFEHDYFLKNPAPFFSLARELIPTSINPTKAHYFIKLLHEKKLLLRHYTQNVDNLDREAGIPELKLVEAHGTFNTSHCVKCGKLYSLSWVKENIFTSAILNCENCGGTVKPDIIFFGESLPPRFFSTISTDFKDCDLLIIMGTSLTVEPFASLVERVSDNCPRIIINDTQVGQNLGISYNQKRKFRDFFLKNTCDDGCQQLIEMLGWKDDFEKLLDDIKENSESKEAPSSAEDSKK